MPPCTVLGKIFASIATDSEFINDFLDIKLAVYTLFSQNMQPGIFLASSDDIISSQFDEQIQAGGLFGVENDFALLAHKSSPMTGKDHGVYAIDNTANSVQTFKHLGCKFVLQKPSIDLMQKRNVILKDESQEYVYSDSAFYFSHKITKLLSHFFVAFKI